MPLQSLVICLPYYWSGDVHIALFSDSQIILMVQLDKYDLASNTVKEQYAHSLGWLLQRMRAIICKDVNVKTFEAETSKTVTRFLLVLYYSIISRFINKSTFKLNSHNVIKIFLCLYVFWANCIVWAAILFPGHPYIESVTHSPCWPVRSLIMSR